jgi:Zn-dependent protease with chaperone function
MTEAELQAVIGHELGHLKCDHGVWLTLANLLTLGVELNPLLPAFVLSNVQDNLMVWWLHTCNTTSLVCLTNACV